MTAGTTPDRTTFARDTEPFRRELFAHCYRMLGSVHDAEDLVQETYLRAWRSYDGFEGRSSLRTWLYRIATGACLNALESRSRRPLPSDLGPANEDPARPLAASGTGAVWLEPVPDALLAGGEDPARIVGARGTVRLAMVAALQHLPPRQRAVLILRDVLAWRAAEVAEVLGTTVPAVNSALQRARAQLATAAPTEDEVVEPVRPADRALLDRYVAAFSAADLTALLGLLTADVELEMPPVPEWYAGLAAAERFLASRLTGPDLYRLVPTAANGQPAAALYRRGPDGVHRAAGVHVLTVAAGRIRRIVAFMDPRLVSLFGLPELLPDR